MKKKYLITIAIVLGVILLDQSSKLYIDRLLPLHYSITIIKNFIHITYVRNTGAAFGLLASQGTGFKVFFFATTSIIAITVIIFFLRSLKDTQTLLASSLSLIMGGAIGNLIDRVRLGEVIDFIDFHWYSYHWPAFNVADSAITVGGVFLIVNTVFRKDKTQ
ncbi:MAG: signal peptidase II [bacterium]|nr:MAG: signal peptidase II [bacterium]